MVTPARIAAMAAPISESRARSSERAVSSVSDSGNSCRTSARRRSTSSTSCAFCPPCALWTKARTVAASMYGVGAGPR